MSKIRRLMLIAIFFIVFLFSIFYCALSLSACSAEITTKEVQSDSVDSENISGYFVEVGRQESYYFMYDSNTKVMYTQYSSLKSGSTSLTVMLKADGMPLTYDEWRNYQNQ